MAAAKACTCEAEETVARLQDHVHDLETRKRAPLYQKKQEEELRAAMDKASDAEARAVDADARAKEAKVQKTMLSSRTRPCSIIVGHCQYK